MLNAAIRGSVAGVAATVPMTVVILGARALGLIGTPPPKQITANAAATAGLRHDVPERHFSAVWLAAHLGYGAACGAVFSLLRPYLPVPYTVAGLAVGEAIWSVSYLGLLPALGLYPLPKDDSPLRTATMIAAHAVFGVSLAETERRLS